MDTPKTLTPRITRLNTPALMNKLGATGTNLRKLTEGQLYDKWDEVKAAKSRRDSELQTESDALARIQEIFDELKRRFSKYGIRTGPETRSIAEVLKAELSTLCPASQQALKVIACNSDGTVDMIVSDRDLPSAGNTLLESFRRELNGFAINLAVVNADRGLRQFQVKLSRRDPF